MILPCRIYLYIYRYRVLPSALLLFDHATGIYIRLRVLFPAARIRCFLHPGIAPRPVSFDMLLSGVCIACFALVRSRSRRRDIRLRVLFTAVRVCCCFPAKISHCRALSHLRCPALYRVRRNRILTIAHPARLPPAKSFCAPDRRASLFSAPHGKVIRTSPHACGVAARKRHAQNVFASLGRPVTARINARMIKYDDFVKIFIIMY